MPQRFTTYENHDWTIRDADARVVASFKVKAEEFQRFVHDSLAEEL